VGKDDEKRIFGREESIPTEREFPPGHEEFPGKRWKVPVPIRQPQEEDVVSRKQRRRGVLFPLDHERFLSHGGQEEFRSLEYVGREPAGGNDQEVRRSSDAVYGRGDLGGIETTEKVHLGIDDKPTWFCIRGERKRGGAV
jgi:hypothetical protein